ncbi:MAG: TonB-dependent hemoglobin/transferrin/lactoferrin family receptor [Burkholderiales bacterium]|nr:TonB-dependent hemoglobin/transferrin/lactoferrin family receptor [Burkholderiales bacterium]
MKNHLTALSLQPTTLALSLAFAWSVPALAQDGAADAVVLPKRTISATRLEAPEDEVAATVTSRDARDVERSQARDLKSLLGDEPGVAVRLQPARMSAVFGSTGRGGNEGINVRGLEDNQVLLQVDGVRLPLGYASGPYVAGRGDYIDVEAFKRVELLRGPASASYGSDGLAGAVSFLTKDPADLLTLGQTSQGSLKLGYASADQSWVAVPSMAVRQGDWEAMLLASVRRGHELDNQGEVDSQNWQSTVPNPQQRSSDYLLAKAVYRLDARHRIKLTLEHIDRQVNTDPIYTVVGMPFVNVDVIDAQAREDIRRSMAKLDWQFEDLRHPWVQRFSAWVYGQDSENHQFGQERYNSPPALWARRTRDTTYGERTMGLGAQGETNLGGQTAHRLLWGADYSDSRITSLKEGAHYDANGDLITSGPASATNTLPNQSFPDSNYRVLGVFVQDQISLGAVQLTPALRFDHFDIDPDVGNPLYTRNNSVTPAALRDGAVSPRLGVVWSLAPLFQPYAQASRGFRAPTPWQINGGVSNPGANPPYRSIGNPDLKPERGSSFELGLRGRQGLWRYGVAVFRSKYRDFILSNVDVTATTAVPLDPGMPANTRTFQSVNAAKATISGFELSGAWQPLPGWTVELRYAHAKGDEDDGSGNTTPLDTIEPDKGTMSLRYEQPRRWGAELTVTGQKSQHRPPASSSALLIPKGYVSADLSAWWDLTRQWQLNLALNNLADVKYALWSDMRGLSDSTANRALLDAYTQPGRNASLSVRYQF